MHVGVQQTPTSLQLDTPKLATRGGVAATSDRETRGSMIGARRLAPMRRSESLLRLAVRQCEQRISGDKIWIAFEPAIILVEPRSIGLLTLDEFAN